MRHQPEIVDVYNFLVKDNADIVGMMAYALYKQNKETHIKEYKENNRREPSRKELTHWKKEELRKEKKNPLLRHFAQETIDSFLNEECFSCPNNKDNVAVVDGGNVVGVGCEKVATDNGGKCPKIEDATIKELWASLKPAHAVAIFTVIATVLGVVIGFSYKVGRIMQNVDSQHKPSPESVQPKPSLESATSNSLSAANK